MANLGDQEWPPGSQGRTEVLPVQWRKHLDLDVSSQSVLLIGSTALLCLCKVIDSYWYLGMPVSLELAPVQTVLGNVSFIDLIQYGALHANPAGVY